MTIAVVLLVSHVIALAAGGYLHYRFGASVKAKVAAVAKAVQS